MKQRAARCESEEKDFFYLLASSFAPSSLLLSLFASISLLLLFWSSPLLSTSTPGLHPSTNFQNSLAQVRRPGCPPHCRQGLCQVRETAESPRVKSRRGEENHWFFFLSRLGRRRLVRDAASFLTQLPLLRGGRSRHLHTSFSPLSRLDLLPLSPPTRRTHRNTACREDAGEEEGQQGAVWRRRMESTKSSRRTRGKPIEFFSFRTPPLRSKSSRLF